MKLQMQQFYITIFIVQLLLIPNCKLRRDSELSENTSEEFFGAINFSDWEYERAKRNSAISKFLEQHKDEYLWFRDNPVAFSGIPFVMFRVFGEIFPNIWNSTTLTNAGLLKWQQEQIINVYSENFDTTKLYNFSSPLPLGLNSTRVLSSTQATKEKMPIAYLRRVNFSCGACHIGRVATGTKFIPLIGAPNLNLDINQVKVLFAQVAADERFTPENFKAAINKRNPAWFHGINADKPLSESEKNLLSRTQQEIALFNSAVGGKIVQETKHVLTVLKMDETQRLARHTYKADPVMLKSPSPGRTDTFAALVQMFNDDGSDDDKLPPEISKNDFPAVWKQSRHQISNWDGGAGLSGSPEDQNKSVIYRNLAAGLSIAGEPDLVDYENAIQVRNLIADLPPPPYPFQINMGKAKRGYTHYMNYCYSCHNNSATKALLENSRDIGTDPNRYLAMREPFTQALLAKGVIDACKDKDESACTQTELNKVFTYTETYKSAPLDGIWARAPYLHNGSVPTLWHLLMGEGHRPAKFNRGSIEYDQDNVGFKWCIPGTASQCNAENVFVDVYDTSKSGQSNKGHQGTKYNGKDWAQDTEGLAELLEYLKTL